MNENYIKIESKSNVENIAPIRICIATFLSSLNIHIDDLMDVKTALSEAITNAVDHAYENGEDNKIVVEAKIKDNERIIIIVKDFGKGIEDISLAMTPMYTSKPENEHAGMGFTIMESFMDEVIVDSVVANGTTITLTKDIKRTISNKV